MLILLYNSIDCRREAPHPAAAAVPHPPVHRPSVPSHPRPLLRAVESRTTCVAAKTTASRPRRQRGIRATATHGCCRPPGRHHNNSRNSSSSRRWAAGRPQISWTSWLNSCRISYLHQVFLLNEYKVTGTVIALFGGMTVPCLVSPCRD